MKKVALYSLLLLAGLVGSQVLPQWFSESYASWAVPIRFLTMICLAYIMIHVGLEFDIDKSNPRRYAWDYAVAATAAAFPWIFCALYFVFAMTPVDLWGARQTWVESLLVSRFSSPTSAGLLFSMLAAAGLATTWVFKKARVLAIFDDLDTVLFMIPLKVLIVGLRWQLGVIAAVIGVLMWAAWTFFRRLKISTTGGWTLFYAVLLAGISEALYAGSKIIDADVPIHLEVLLPAFVLGCVMAKKESAPDHEDESAISTVVSPLFMVFVGLSMPLIEKSTTGVAALGGLWPGWGTVIFHVAMITLISNLGKMFSVFCYRSEATFRERLAVSVAMFPRGEVGAGVLVVSLSYGIGGPAVTVALLSLALNLMLTGVFILLVKGLLATPAPEEPKPAHVV